MADVKVRYRVNVSTTAKGVKSYDCTVDSDNLDQDDVILASDRLVAKLEERYGLAAQLERLEGAVAEIKKAQQEA